MCQIDVCTCTRLFETMPGVQPPSRSPATLPPPGQPATPIAPSRSCALPRGCHHPYRAIPTLTATYTFCHRPPTSPLPSPPQLAVTPVSAASPLLPSATRNHHPPLFARRVRRSSLSPFSLSLSVSTSVFLKRPIQSAWRVRRVWHKYGNTGAVSQRECDNTKNFD